MNMIVFKRTAIAGLVGVLMNASTGVAQTANLNGIDHLQKSATDTTKMQWFGDAKLGIFIHWGIYAVNGIDESWSFHNRKISHADYMKQLKGFTASKYN